MMRQPTATGAAYVVYGADDKALTEVTLTTAAGPVKLKLRPWWPAVAVVSKDGKLLMVVADGQASVGGEAVLAGGPMAGAASLDGQDLRTSKAVLVCPFEAGELKLGPLPAAGDWGEPRNGKWVACEAAKAEAGVLDVTADRASLVALLVRGEAAAWRGRMTTLATAPWKVRGY
jgi:hypothetical protein